MDVPRTGRARRSGHHDPIEAATDTPARIVWAGSKLGTAVIDSDTPFPADTVAQLRDTLHKIGLPNDDPNIIGARVAYAISYAVKTLRGPS